jgi:hypothetical protein
VNAGDYLGVLDAIDRLLEAVVTDPGAWSDRALGEWANDLAMGRPDPFDRATAREIRRVVRIAARLRNYWDEQGTGQAPADWRSRVDIAVAGRGWRPGLAIAQTGLAAVPSEELFAQVQERFRVVFHERWMEGVSFDEWVAGNS